MFCSQCLFGPQNIWFGPMLICPSSYLLLPLLVVGPCSGIAGPALPLRSFGSPAFGLGASLRLPSHAFLPYCLYSRLLTFVRFVSTLPALGLSVPPAVYGLSTSPAAYEVFRLAPQLRCYSGLPPPPLSHLFIPTG